jgi:osmotically-inducible protein OsmY
MKPRELTVCPPNERDARDLKATVAETLDHSGYSALSLVGCEVRGDAIILQGSVPTYYLKQLAQAFALRVAGAKRVDNRLAVRRHDR